MAYASVTVPLSEDLNAYVDARVDVGSYGTPSEYIRELILNDRDRQLSRLEDRLLGNLKSKPVRLSRGDFGKVSFVESCRTRLQEAE